jgi:hypothetical protein
VSQHVSAFTKCGVGTESTRLSLPTPRPLHYSFRPIRNPHIIKYIKEENTNNQGTIIYVKYEAQLIRQQP